MKNLHGKRHIRACRSVAVGRQRRQWRKLKSFSSGLGRISRITSDVESAFENMAKSFSKLNQAAVNFIAAPTRARILHWIKE